jgi:hypothetical protein
MYFMTGTDNNSKGDNERNLHRLPKFLRGTTATCKWTAGLHSFGSEYERETGSCKHGMNLLTLWLHKRWDISCLAETTKKVKLSTCLTKHYPMKACGGVDV